MASADDSATTNADNSNNKLYKGVRKRKWGKWVSEIRLPNSRERIWLGSYDSPEKAARAFDAALYCLRGRHANFNFPDTPFNLDISVVAAGNGNQSLTPQEIQAVAAKFANELDPPHDHDLDLDQEQEPSQLTQGGRGSGDSSITETSYGTVQVDNMDWTFLNVLDHEYNEVVSDYGLYSGLDKMHSGELFYNSSLSPPPPSLPFEDNIDGDNEIEGDDAFSHHSFLWNWNF